MPLTDVRIRQAKPGAKALKLPDGNGLYLFVLPNGSKLWRYRYKIKEKENLFAIGEYPHVSLSDARDARLKARALVKDGQHPAQVRKHEKQTALGADTFKVVALEWYEKKKKAGWSAYYAGQVLGGLENDLFPEIGSLRMRKVTAGMLYAALQKVEDRGAKTVAINLRQWSSAIFRHGVITGRADTDPAAALRGAIIRDPVEHAKALQPAALGDFLVRLRAYQGNRATVICMRLKLLFMTRTVELRKAEWPEFDKADWKVPADRMKKRRVHVVPLARQAQELLEELRAITGAGRYLFPNHRKPKDPMGATTINRALEYMGYPLGDLSAHDFRATATTALYEMGYRRELVEMQLAHAKKDKTEAAYNHAEYLPERRKMLQAWADYLDELEAKAMQQRPAAVKSTDQSPTRPKPKRGRRASSAGEKSPR